MVLLLDTSVIIDLAKGQLRSTTVPLENGLVSAVTLAGLHHGVLSAPPERLAQRLATLDFVRENIPALPIDERVAAAYGRLASTTRRTLNRRVRLGDGLIAATAIAHSLVLYTRDDDFEGLPELESVRL